MTPEQIKSRRRQREHTKHLLELQTRIEKERVLRAEADVAHRKACYAHEIEVSRLYALAYKASIAEAAAKAKEKPVPSAPSLQAFPPGWLSPEDHTEPEELQCAAVLCGLALVCIVAIAALLVFR